MRLIHHALIIILLVIFFGVIVIHAQDVCDTATSEVIEIVEYVCSELDNNQVCYGNFEVGADLQEDIELPDFNFETPGDLADLENIKSIYLSALDPEADIWGIAQMLLLASTSKGTQELNLLLFGDVEVETAVESSLVVQVQVGIYSANIRNLPTVDGLILQSVESGALLEAIGRLEDSSWVRVRTDTGAVGWISTDLIAPIHEDEYVDDLDIQDSSSPYFGSNASFYFEQGSGSACDNITADGLIIQTPQGPASVSISINGVSIDLIPGQTGASAYLQGTSSDMTITVMSGNSYVSANGTGYYVGTGEETTISIGNDGLADGAPSFPTTYDAETINNLPNFDFIPPIGSVPSVNSPVNDTPSPEATATVEEVTGTDTTAVADTTGTTNDNTSSGESTACEQNTNSGKACGTTGDENSDKDNKTNNGKGNDK